jgi:hypothetical protein
MMAVLIFASWAVATLLNHVAAYPAQSVYRNLATHHLTGKVPGTSLNCSEARWAAGGTFGAWAGG